MTERAKNCALALTALFYVVV